MVLLVRQMCGSGCVGATRQSADGAVILTQWPNSVHQLQG